MTGKSALGGEERPLCCVIKGVGAGGERRKRREEQKKGKGGGGREGGRREWGRKGSPAGPHLDPERRRDVRGEPLTALLGGLKGCCF